MLVLIVLSISKRSARTTISQISKPCTKENFAQKSHVLLSTLAVSRFEKKLIT
jgi:hypothetical protein